MGFPAHRFVSDVDDNLLCSVCSAILEDVVLTPCGHSFCLLCLETWLANPSSNHTCPECRSRVYPGESRPIHSVRNLIKAMDIKCENSARGCKDILTVDKFRHHMDTCGYSPVDCAGCGECINKDDLVDHHTRCQAIARILNPSPEQDDASRDSQVPDRTFREHEPQPLASATCFENTYVSELTFRVTSLEIQIDKMQRDLEIADGKNKKLDRELKRTREDLQDKRSQLMEHQYVDFDTDYDYGYTPQSITKLANLISRFLLKKPPYIDETKMFDALKRCYENFAILNIAAYRLRTSQKQMCSSAGRARDCDGSHGMKSVVCFPKPFDYIHDVHMLIATAHASSWFTPAQKLILREWLSGITSRC